VPTSGFDHGRAVSPASGLRSWLGCPCQRQGLIMAGLYLPASTLRSWPGAGGECAGQCRQRQGLIVPGSQRAVHDSPWCVPTSGFDHGRAALASVNASIMAGLYLPASTLRSWPGCTCQRQRFDHGRAALASVNTSIMAGRWLNIKLEYLRGYPITPCKANTGQAGFTVK